MASTVVLVRVLSDTRQLHTSAGHIAVGWLVVEDVITVVMLVLLPALVGARATLGGVAGILALTILKVGGLIALAVTLGTRAIPRLTSALM